MHNCKIPESEAIFLSSPGVVKPIPKTSSPTNADEDYSKEFIYVSGKLAGLEKGQGGLRIGKEQSGRADF